MRHLVVSSLVLSIWAITGQYVFAQNCPVCDLPPPHLQRYEAVMTELISYIETTPQNNQGETPGKVGLAVTSALDASLTSIALAKIMPVQTVGDLFGSVQMLAGSETLVRDWQILLRIDKKIALQVLAMIQGSRNSDSIPDATLDKINASLSKLGYVKLNKQEKGYVIDAKGKNGATYGDLAMLLRQLNMFYKQVHTNRRYHPILKDIGEGYRKTDQEDDEAGSETFDQEDIQSFMRSVEVLANQSFAPLYGFFRGPTHDWLDFSDADGKNQYKQLYITIREVQSQYECSVGLKSDCSEWKEVRQEALTLAKDRIINEGGKAMTTFKDAWGRLKGALGRGSSADKRAASQRKQALLYSQWGPLAGEEKERLLEVDTHIEPAPQTVGSLRKSITKVFRKKSATLLEDEMSYPNSSNASVQTIADSQKDAQLYDQDKDTIIQKQLDETASWPQDKNTAESLGLKNSASQMVLDQQTQRMQQTFLSVLGAQQVMQTEAIFTDVNRTTHRFPLLSASVYKNIDIIGNKNDNGKLYNAMGSVCDQQCSNLGPNCRYITQ